MWPFPFRAVITGGSTGIGFGTAQALVAEGAEVLITGRAETSHEAARARGARAHVLRSDSASLSDVAALGTQVERTFGSVDRSTLSLWAAAS